MRGGAGRAGQTLAQGGTGRNTKTKCRGRGGWQGQPIVAGSGTMSEIRIPILYTPEENFVIDLWRSTSPEEYEVFGSWKEYSSLFRNSKWSF